MNAFVGSTIERGVGLVRSYRIVGNDAFAAVLSSVESQLSGMKVAYRWLADYPDNGAIKHSRCDFEVDDWHYVALGTGAWSAHTHVTSMASAGDIAELKSISEDYRCRPAMEHELDGVEYSCEDLVSDMHYAVDVMISKSLPILHRVALRCGPQNLKESRVVQRWAMGLLRSVGEARAASKSAEVLVPSDRCGSEQHHGRCCRWHTAKEAEQAARGRLADMWKNPGGRLSLSAGNGTDETIVEVKGRSGAVYPFAIAEYLTWVPEGDRHPAVLNRGNVAMSADELFRAKDDRELSDLLMRLPVEHIATMWDDNILGDVYPVR